MLPWRQTEDFCKVSIYSLTSFQTTDDCFMSLKMNNAWLVVITFLVRPSYDDDALYLTTTFTDERGIISLDVNQK